MVQRRCLTTAPRELLLVEKAARPDGHRLSPVCHRLSPGRFWVEKAARHLSRFVTGMSPPGFEPRNAADRGLATEPMDLLDQERRFWVEKQPAELVTACHWYVTACHRGAFGWKKQPAEPVCHRRDSRRRKLGLPRFVSPAIFQAGQPHGLVDLTP